MFILSTWYSFFLSFHTLLQLNLFYLYSLLWYSSCSSFRYFSLLTSTLLSIPYLLLFYLFHDFLLYLLCHSESPQLVSSIQLSLFSIFHVLYLFFLIPSSYFPLSIIHFPGSITSTECADVTDTEWRDENTSKEAAITAKRTHDSHTARWRNIPSHLLCYLSYLLLFFFLFIFFFLFFILLFVFIFLVL